MTDENKEVEQGRDNVVWQDLWAFAQSCINWGESDVYKKKFIEEGEKSFIIFLIE